MACMLPFQASMVDGMKEFLSRLPQNTPVMCMQAEKDWNRLSSNLTLADVIKASEVVSEYVMTNNIHDAQFNPQGVQQSESHLPTLTSTPSLSDQLDDIPVPDMPPPLPPTQFTPHLPSTPTTTAILTPRDSIETKTEIKHVNKTVPGPRPPLTPKLSTTDSLSESHKTVSGMLGPHPPSTPKPPSTLTSKLLSDDEESRSESTSVSGPHPPSTPKPPADKGPRPPTTAKKVQVSVCFLSCAISVHLRPLDCVCVDR